LQTAVGMSTHNSLRVTSRDPRAAFAVAAFTLAMGAAATGCGSDPAPPMPDDARRNVMVIDDGIDLALPSFQGNVAAAHTVVCDPQMGRGDATDPTNVQVTQPADVQALKNGLITELGRPDESCHLRSGIDPKPPVGQDVVARRERWNRALLDDDDFTTPDLKEVLDRLVAELETTSFHGTATAGLIAYGATDLRMVLVERPLYTPEQAADAVKCIDPAAIDLAVTLLSDPEVRAAVVASPLPSIDRELRDLRAARGVTLVNESFGSLTPAAIEQLLQLQGCPAVDLKKYVQVANDLMRDQDRAHPEPGVLFVRSAGNDGSQLDQAGDAFQCRPGDSQQVLVGAYGFDGQRADFTNFGSCVDLYAPGEAIVAPVPGDWMMLLDGTSFSAPLVVRHLRSVAPQPFTPEAARAALLAERDSSGFLSVARFPSELVFDVNVAKRKHAAAQSTTTSAPSSALTAAMPNLRAVAMRAHAAPDLAALRRALRPLNWAAGRQPVTGARPR
jgi:subtilisin family serine protease